MVTQTKSIDSLVRRLAGVQSQSMQRASILIVLGLVAMGCGDDGPPLGPPDGSPLDAYDPPWWTPEPGEAKNWDIQLATPFDVTAQRQMYDLDLWDLATATTIDYGGGSTVAVPAGPLAGQIATLHATGAKVVCHIDTGAIALNDPDAMKFPGFKANPPDNPTPPAAGSVIGWSTGDGKRFLDIRAASLPLWQSIMVKRFDLAKTLGCDAVDAHHNDSVGSISGFAITAPDSIAWYTEIASQLHSREISAGYRTSTDAGNLESSGLTDAFDWVLIERCGEFANCDQVQTFAQARKAIFALDYQINANGGTTFTLACGNEVRMEDGIHKNDPPDGAYRMQCP